VFTLILKENVFSKNLLSKTADLKMDCKIDHRQEKRKAKQNLKLTKKRLSRLLLKIVAVKYGLLCYDAMY